MKNWSNIDVKSWADNDLYICETLVGKDRALKNALKSSAENNFPQDYEISETQGKFLYLLAKIAEAKRILELGTFLGYSTIWLAKAVPADGTVISLEYVEDYANVALKNIEYAGLSDRVEIRQGAAVDVLKKMIASNEEPFDMVFMDADKPEYPIYLELILQLSKSGTIIYGDNVVRNGQLCDADSSDPKVQGVRKFVENLGKSNRIESTLLQTVGIKGYDGFTLSIVK